MCNLYYAYRTYFFEPLRRSHGVSETASTPPNVTPAPPIASGEPEAEPGTVLRSEATKDWQDPTFQVFDRMPGEDEPKPPTYDRVKRRRGIKHLQPRPLHVKQFRLPPRYSHRSLSIVIAFLCKMH